MVEALDIRVRGIVQGVGFRPFVYRLARRYIINGWVLNDLDGVFIHAEGESNLLDEFVTELHMNPPAAAVVREVELKEVPLQDCSRFEIRASQVDTADEGTLVSADLATCDDCLRELFDPSDRRYRYPFINCTNCGPRFTIIDSLPYDRPATSMAGFTMCDDCAREYADPADRRFHAQPDACWECGPLLSWVDLRSDDSTGEVPASDLSTSSVEMRKRQSEDMLARSVQLLATGGILAVKGLGGFHLACDASDETAIAYLRNRKRRDGKAFAVMVPDVDSARMVCNVSPAEEVLLKSAARPIVLLRKRSGVSLAHGLADKLPELGVMLPATPVQHLLLQGFYQVTNRSMLVMTSGNVHDEPIVTDDGEACEKFSGIADAVLGNNRPILSRYDDSVVRVIDVGGASDSGEPNEAIQFIRRARGYAPVPLDFSREAAQSSGSETVFAAGSQQKNTFTFMKGDKAYVSQHIGDMEDADVNEAWLEAKGRFERLFGLGAQKLACDAHPEYLASKWAHRHAFRDGVPLTEVQHHHAHIASVLGEHGLFGPAIGVAFDGTGYGADGKIWGGEVLVSNQVDYERFANLSYMPMPGGTAAVRNPLRMAFGMLWSFDLLDHPGAKRLLDDLGDAAVVCEQMIENGLNTPYTSSAGRLFDAVSALVGTCTQPTYEGEAAILLDAARVDGEVSAADRARYAMGIAKNAATETSTAHDTSVVLIDAEPTICAVLDDIAAGVPAGEVSLRFHDAVVEGIVQVCELANAVYGIRLVALSGGCFMNRYLVEQSSARLGKAGFTVALNASLPPNDGCVSFGQAVVACSSR